MKKNYNKEGEKITFKDFISFSFPLMSFITSFYMFIKIFDKYLSIFDLSEFITILFVIFSLFLSWILYTILYNFIINQWDK